MILFKQVKLPIGHSKADLEKLISEISQKAFQTKYSSYVLRKQSLDARRKGGAEMFYVYEVALNFDGWDAGKQQKQALRASKIKKCGADIMYLSEEAESYPFEENAKRLRVLLEQNVLFDPRIPKIAVIGFGPAGIFASYLLAMAGLKPVVLERGQCMEERTATVSDFWKRTEEYQTRPENEMYPDPESNVSFGEGGAGTFSDGKLNTLIKTNKDYHRYVLETLVAFGAPEDILIRSMPHIGTDCLSRVIVDLRKKILELGGSVRFQTRADDLIFNGNYLTAIQLADGEILPTDRCILATGHSARDTFRTLYVKQIPMEAKPFAVGVRVMHPQSMIDHDQYKGAELQYGLPAASYKLTAQVGLGQDPRSVYSFCMCPGGYVVNASSQAGRLAINGMSDHARNSGVANSAIVCNVDPSDFPSDAVLAGMDFQEEIERKAFQAGHGAIPTQRMGEFLHKDEAELSVNNANDPEAMQPVTKGGYHYTDLDAVLPDFVGKAIREALPEFDKKLPGFTRPDAIVCAIESRTSSPVRILRDPDSLQSSFAGLYPCGEGAGYAGGITSAAIDGLRCADKIICEVLEMIEKMNQMELQEHRK
ncbi:MAG: FAD-dependent oxidoreductase [Lachnospiraceae bacterium]|nr:FAD-dependent oxidoreductase [Lachnospiraceae bacterium]